jgi:hypothetical protein
VRWLIALAMVVAVGRADAGTFKARGGDKSKPAAKTEPAKKTEPKKTEPAKKVEKTDADSEKKPATKTAQKAPAKKPPAKKPTSQVATKGRPNDLTPTPKKKGDVTITEDEEDVIIRDLDD